MKIGIFGVTANPIHIGHVNAIKYALNYVDEVWVSPVVSHPFGKKFLDYDLRVKMLKESLSEFGNERILIKELDKEYWEKFHKQIYSYDLLNYLKEKYNKNEFKLIISEDNAKIDVWKKFYNYEKIDVEFGKIICPDIGPHSTDIRKLIQNKESINCLVGEKVANFIKENNLYCD